MGYSESAVYPRDRRQVEEVIHVALAEEGFRERRDEDGTIRASTGMSLLSWGEQVRMTVEDLAGNQVRVEYISEPSLSTNVLGGKGRSNVRRIREAVERRMR